MITMCLHHQGDRIVSVFGCTLQHFAKYFGIFCFVWRSVSSQQKMFFPCLPSLLAAEVSRLQQNKTSMLSLPTSPLGAGDGPLPAFLMLVEETQWSDFIYSGCYEGCAVTNKEIKGLKGPYPASLKAVYYLIVFSTQLGLSVLSHSARTDSELAGFFFHFTFWQK